MTGSPSGTARLATLAGWACAAVAAGGMHLAVGIWLANATIEPRAPSEDAGFMIVEFAELPAAPESTLADLPPAPEQIFQEAVDGQQDDEPIVEPEEPEIMPREIMPPEPDVEPEPEPEPEPVEAPEAEPSLQTGSLPEVADPEFAVPLPPHRPQGLVAAPARREVPSAARQAQNSPRRASVDSAAGAAPVAPAARAAAPLAGRDPARANALPASWQARLVAHLERHRRYPQAARASGRQGVVHLRFTIDRSGTVLGQQIARSSGAADLDAAAIAMVRRASPVPSLPDDAPATVSLTVPVRFEVR